MAGSRTKGKTRERRSADGAGTRSAANGAGKRQAPTAGEPKEYAKEALSQWGTAARLGAAAVVPKAKRMIAKAGVSANGESKDASLRERLDPSRTDKGGAAGTAVDKLLSKGGLPGRAMAKLSLGSRVAERLRGSGGADGSAADDETPASAPVPIQEAVTVAVPVALAYRLCLRLEDYPAFLDRVKEVEVSDDQHAEFLARIRGTDHRIAVEIFDRWENERIDWRSAGELEHSGVITFHELAPRLTYVDLSVDIEPHGPLQRLARATHLSDRSVRTELQRFKAYAELYEDEGDAEVYAEVAEVPDEEEAAGDREEPEPDEEEEK